MTDEQRIAMREAFQSAEGLIGNAIERMKAAHQVAKDAGQEGMYLSYDAEDAIYGLRRLESDIQETLRNMEQDDTDED